MKGEKGSKQQPECLPQQGGKQIKPKQAKGGKNKSRDQHDQKRQTVQKISDRKGSCKLSVIEPLEKLTVTEIMKISKTETKWASLQPLRGKHEPNGNK